MAAATMYVTVAGAGAKDGAAWASAMGEAEFETDLEGGAEAGDIYYVASGAADGTSAAYTLDSSYDSSARVGTLVAPISIIGVKYGTTNEPPVLADWGSALNRPHFVIAANMITLGNYYKVFNLSWTGTSSSIFLLGSNGTVFNCKAVNTRGTPNFPIQNGTQSMNISCELISAAGNAWNGSTGANIILFCYLHDSVGGLTVTGLNYVMSAFNVIDTCTTGITMGTGSRHLHLNNTIYNCTTGVSGTTGYGAFINNIFDTITDAFVWTTQTDQNFFAYNHRGNSVTDMYDTANNKVATTAPHGDLWVTGGAGADPHFTNEAGGDLSLETDSPCLDTGMAITLGVG